MIRVDGARRLLAAGGREMPCAIGRSGTIAAAAKREGDGASPIGAWGICAALFRPDRVPPPPPMALPWRWIRPDDGWSDDPRDPAYNRPVRHPHAFSAERLWRDDGLYDVIVLLDHNSAPPRPGAGSAIFLHCWRAGAATQGCVAIPRDRLLALLPVLTPGEPLVIA